MMHCSSLWIATLCLLAFAEGDSTCTYHKLGCISEHSSPMSELLFSVRKEIDWLNFESFTKRLVCKCIDAARQRGMKYIAIRFYGLCYGGNDPSTPKLVKDLYLTNSECMNGNYGNCKKSDSVCTGGSYYDFVYSTELEPEYGQWSKWSSCSATCGHGTIKRHRECMAGKDSHVACEGPHAQTKSCVLRSCPPSNHDISSWGSWSKCSVTCGSGIQIREKKCNGENEKFGGEGCPETMPQTRECKISDCHVKAEYGPWGKWSECSVTCGNGTATRMRVCTKHNKEGTDTCEGPKNESKMCRVKDCPKRPEYGPWGKWSECSTTCGNGTETRRRICIKHKEDSPGACKGPGSENRKCKLKDCPRKPEYGPWHKWSACSVTCGNGTQLRKRVCIYHHKNTKDSCQGPRSENRVCKIKECPLKPEYAPWGMWNECSVSCGAGMQTRERECIIHEGSSVKICNGPKTESRKCEVKKCPVINGAFGNWSPWGSCMPGCGDGTSTRRRQCNNPEPSNGGKDCSGIRNETRECHVPKCFEMTLCNGKTRTFRCFFGKQLQIVSASYGRLAARTCSLFLSYPICKNSVLDKVRDRCEGKSRCRLSATESEFGKICSESYPYLQVEFKCKKAEERWR